MVRARTSRLRLRGSCMRELKSRWNRISHFLRNFFQPIERLVQLVSICLVIRVNELVQHLLQTQLERAAKLVGFFIGKVELFHCG